MEKLLYNLVLGSLICLAPACNKWTDITPKGKNILNRVTDLDELLNYNYVITDLGKFDDVNTLTDIYPYATNVPSVINAASKSLTYALVAFDESVDRVTLTASDIKYEHIYAIIDNVANIVLTNADNASGDRAKANQLKAEAYILRAYFHYMLVNFYAKAYDPNTAVRDGGIPYVTDNDITSSNKKNTVAEVYTQLLSDIDAALQLNSLPEIPENTMRVGKAFAYAVKAKVLLSMRDYAGALGAADSSLAINSVLSDRRQWLKAPNGPAITPGSTAAAADNLFFMSYALQAPLLQAPTNEVLNNVYEPGDILKDSVKIYPIANPISGVTNSKIWYTPTYAFAWNTGGLTTADMYLVRSECLARTQMVTDAGKCLDSLRERRIFPYQPITATTEAGLMTVLMRTARIEHLFTYKNFVDIKRWNAEGTYQQTISRNINGVSYQLNPGSPLYIFPFPQSATSFNQNLTQNY